MAMFRAASIRSQLLALIGLAVLPAVVLSTGLTWHAYRSVKRADASYQMQTAANVASQVRGAVHGANLVAYTLLTNQSGDGKEAFCATLGRHVAIDRRTAAYGYYRNGELVCTAGQAQTLSGFSPAAIAAAARPVPLAGSDSNARREAMLTSTTQPTHLAAASFKGTQGTGTFEMLLTVLSPDHLREKVALAPARLSGSFAILDNAFAVISDISGGPDVLWLPADSKILQATRSGLTSGKGRDGLNYVYVSSAIEDGVAYILAAKPEARFGQAEQQLFIGLTVPLLIFGIVMAVAWRAIDLLFLQWMRRLAITAHSLSYGDFNVRAALPADAPLELRQYADAFDQMTEVLATRTRELATVANQRSALLKELHHRVKNNFQVIASFLNLTKRQKSGETYEALALSECRVHAMATAYKLALAHGDISLAPLAPLVNEVLAYVQQSADAPASIATTFADSGAIQEQYLELDRAIPMALLLVEVTWPLLSGTQGNRPRARIDCYPDGERMTLVVVDLGDSIVAPAGQRQAVQMSKRLRQAFIHQIDGQPLDDAQLDALGCGHYRARAASPDEATTTQPASGRDAGGHVILAISIPVRPQDGAV